jgi:hypothetical protein
MKGLIIACVALMLAACATSPPRNPLNLCSVFAEKSDWREPAREAQKQWGIPVSVLMATIYHESSYRHDALPPKRYFLGFIPMGRVSSAYGYSQALDGTWDEYVTRQNRWFASRENFADAIDFVGWYHYGTSKELGIRSDDMRNLYLAYHEGRAGFARNSYMRKQWLMAYANRVTGTERSYRQQLTSCSAWRP